MARRFISASSQYLEYVGAPLTAGPMSLAAWYKPTIFGNTTLFVLSNLSNTRRFNLGTVNGACRILQAGSAASPSATTTDVSPVGVWAHYGGRLISNTNRDAFLNGRGKTNNTINSGAVTAPTRVVIGAINSSAGITGQTDGDVADVALWNVALEDSEFLVLALGVSPLLIRPQNLIFYYPLRGSGLEVDFLGRYPALPTNNPTQISDVDLIRRQVPYDLGDVGKPASAAAVKSLIWWAQYGRAANL